MHRKIWYYTSIVPSYLETMKEHYGYARALRLPRGTRGVQLWNIADIVSKLCTRQALSSWLFSSKIIEQSDFKRLQERNGGNWETKDRSREQIN